MTPNIRCGRVILIDSRISFHPQRSSASTRRTSTDKIKAIDDRTLRFEVDQRYAPSFVLYVLSSFTGGIVDSEHGQAA